jgi:hypothetical protein
MKDMIVEKLKANIPVLEWLPRYYKAYLRTDVPAGLTSGAG